MRRGVYFYGSIYISYFWKVTGVKGNYSEQKRAKERQLEVADGGVRREQK